MSGLEPRHRILVGDARAQLAELEPCSVDAIVTSPPYFGLRDYGVEGQLGLEASPAEYVEALVATLREARTALAPHGTLWLNLGDSYTSGGRGWYDGGDQVNGEARGHRSRPPTPPGLKEKELVGIPWRVALALQADGWWLRAEVIWAKQNPMPESVTDRPTRAHEHVFLLTRQARYWYDAEAVKDPVAGAPGLGRNARTIWEIPTGRFGGAHFAVFPPELPTRCIHAGAAREVCEECGRARERIVERLDPVLGPTTWSGEGAASYDDGEGGYVQASGSSTLKHLVPTRTVGWTDCGHGAYRRGVVLDPFLGAGTTAVAALRAGRDAVGIELNPEYADLAARRLARWWEDATLAEVEPPEGQMTLA